MNYKSIYILNINIYRYMNLNRYMNLYFIKNQQFKREKKEKYFIIAHLHI